MELHSFTTAALGIVLVALVASFIVGMYRLLSGPSLPDRVIALDYMAFVMIAVMSVYAAYSGQPAYLNVALAVALVAFLGTIAFARFIERLSRGNARSDAVD